MYINFEFLIDGFVFILERCEIESATITEYGDTDDVFF